MGGVHKGPVDPATRAALAELARVECVVSSLYAELHSLTTTWGRSDDEGADVVPATCVETMIRRVQLAVVAADVALRAAADVGAGSSSGCN